MAEKSEICQSWGATLAIFGVKTLKNRKKLIQNLSINIDWFLIGANDIASEGNWKWANGEPASSSELIWYSGEPNDAGGYENCVLLPGYPSSLVVGLAWDDKCTRSLQGLGEKMI